MSGRKDPALACTRLEGGGRAGAFFLHHPPFAKFLQFVSSSLASMV